MTGNCVKHGWTFGPVPCCSLCAIVSAKPFLRPGAEAFIDRAVQTKVIQKNLNVAFEKIRRDLGLLP